MDGTVVTISEGVITSVIPSHLQGADFDFSGKYKTLNIYKFSAEFCRSVFAGLLRYYAQSVDGSVYYELILGILIYLKQARIHAVLVEPGERWAEIDDPNDLAVARFTFQEHDRRSILEATYGGWWAHDVLDFCFLRNMYWPTSAMLSELRRDLPQLLHSYGSTQAVLDRKLQWWLLCREGHATTLAGLSQVYPWLSQRLAGKRVLLPSPTFGEYPRAFPKHETYCDNFRIDLGELEKRLPGAEVCVVVAPNNPTGTEVETAALHALIARHPRVLFLVDESFQGFSTQPSLMTLLEREPLRNALILVSLSKTLGIPGARLGYVYTCDAAWRDALRSTLPIWNLSSLAERVLEIGLKHRPALYMALRDTRRDRARFAEDLRSLDAIEQVIEGGANFVLAAVRRQCLPPVGVVEHLLAQHRIMTKDVSTRIADGGTWLRLAVRLPQENRLLVEALAALSR
jgi:histidinol-phosphate/aromatic aminotransferase/cobyric acid decarboxylase-like protein